MKVSTSRRSTTWDPWLRSRGIVRAVVVREHRKIAPARLSRAFGVFVGHLRERGCVAGADAPQPIAIVAEFLQWMRAHRGAVEKTLATYRLYVTNLVEFLGDDPCTYSAGGLRDFLAKRYPHYGRRSIRHVVTAVRMFLRYLAVDGRCRVGLDQALTSPPNWSRQSLPRGLSAQDVNRVLMSCPKTPIVFLRPSGSASVDSSRAARRGRGRSALRGSLLRNGLAASVWEGRSRGATAASSGCW